MLLSKVTGEHFGTLYDFDTYGEYPKFLRLYIKFDDYEEVTNDPKYPNQIVTPISGNYKELGNKIQRLELNKLKEQRLRISHQENSKIYRIYSDNNLEIAIISSTSDWSEEELTLLQEKIQDDFTDLQLSNLFCRPVEQIARESVKLRRSERIEALTNIGEAPLKKIELNEHIFTYGVAIREGVSDDYYGMSYHQENNKLMDKKVRKEDTLFKLNISETKKLLTILDDDFILSPDSRKRSCFVNKPFMSVDEKLFMWIKIEDSGNDNFNSYSFAFSDDREILKDWTQKNEPSFLRQIMFLRSESTKILVDLNIKESKETRFQAIKSAISAIMSRNMSHNLGSHVLYYTQRDLLSIANELDGGISSIYNNIGTEETTTKINEFYRKHYDKYVRGASLIVSFMKNRMNFLAAISEDNKFPALPVNFESEIFRYLDIDNRNDIKPVINFYLNNLIRSEGFVRSKDANFSSSNKLTLEIDNRITNGEEVIKYLSLAFPGGALSTHAFFNIIENFIRNSAKYWSPTSVKFQGDLKFTFRINIIDGKNKGKSNLKGEFLHFVIYDNKGDNKDIVDSLNDKIKHISILNEEDNSINKEDKGLKEMLLSYLSSINPVFHAI